MHFGKLLHPFVAVLERRIEDCAVVVVLCERRSCFATDLEADRWLVVSVDDAFFLISRKSEVEDLVEDFWWKGVDLIDQSSCLSVLGRA